MTTHATAAAREALTVKVATVTKEQALASIAWSLLSIAETLDADREREQEDANRRERQRQGGK